MTDRAEAPELNEEQVRQYLVENSDFLQRHPELMDHLHISHGTGSAVSLVEKQVSVLRERNVEMRRRLSALTSNAKENDTLFQRTSALVLRLLEADTAAELCDSFCDAMKREFGVDYATLILFGDSAQASGPRTEDLQHARDRIGALLRGSSATCGALREEQLRFLFPEAGATGSAAAVPLGPQAELGVLAVGSADAARYHSGMDTLFLDHLAQVILRLLPRLQQAQAA